MRVGTDDSVTLTIHRAELGQGLVTALSMLLAEELECDWSKIRTEFAKVDPANYGVFGSPTLQGVFGSLSIRTSWDPLRKAGATAREMLVSAAAQKWGVDKSQCRAENSSVVNTATNARLSYGSLAEAASKVPPPGQRRAEGFPKFHLIGTSPKRLDTRLKVTGKAQYGIDVRVPGMQYAVLERCPVFGGKVASFDATQAKAVPGVKKVVQISNGVAVIADNTWSAMAGPPRVEGPMERGRTGQYFERDHPHNVCRSSRKTRRRGVEHRQCRRQPCPAPRRRSKRFTKRPIFRTLRWSRIAAWSRCSRIAARSGPGRRSPARRAMRPR